MGKINLNYSKLKIPEGDYTFGLNVINDIEKQGNLTNELGNIKCGDDLPGKPVGIISLNGTQVVIFCDDNSIQLVDTETCVITQLIQNDGFNFSIDNIITGTSKVKEGCQTIFYWFDHNNPDRYYNIDRPEKFLTGGVFDISKTEFNPDIVHPTIKTQILNNGGNIEFGLFNFAVTFLNQNKDEIFTSPVDINYTPIIYQQIEGALNLSTNLPDIGGKPVSNKSIKLTITNIPEDAVLARIVVFRHITSDGFTSDAHVIGELIPVNGTTIEYTYRGFNTSNGDYYVDKNEYLTPKAIYQSSLNGVQVNNRLIRYNLKETIRDYSNYQEKASKICSKYVVKEVNKSDPNVYLLNQTFLGGEIILPAINWVHKDGSISNAYPLIGRAKLPNDEILVDDILNTGQQVEKWNYFDTSIKDATPIDGHVSSGEFGYYESSQLYSDPPNYCGSNYWGTDCNGNNLEDSPVRLFVVPDRSVEVHDDGDNIRPIGIWFDETTIEFPNDDVVGYYFSIVVVNQSNIEAKGVAFSVDPQIAIDPNNDAIAFPPTYFAFDLGSQDGYYNLMSANYLLSGSRPDGEYMTLEGNWNVDFEDFDESYDGIFEDDLPYSDLDIYFGQVNASTYSSDIVENQVIDLNISIEPSTAIIQDNQVYKNLSNTNPYHIIQLGSEYSTHNVVNYVAVKNSLNPIPNIWSIVTRRITNLNETVSFNGDKFISPLNIDNIGTIYGAANFFFWQGGEINARTETIKGFMAESTYNSYLRHLGSDSCSSHTQNVSSLEAFYIQKITEPYKDKLKVKDSICPFFPGYNKDYSYIQELNKYSTIGFVFDFCSECTGEYPHRIIFSPQSFSEDLADGYRINKPNDYIDIPANTGSIIAVDFKDNKLVVRTERSCYFIQPNPQQMETSETNIYIGTGDFLSIPPQELNVTPVGYGGQQHKLDSLNTEKGLVWSDRRKGQIYLIGGEFKKLHEDMDKWFGDNLPKAHHLIFSYDSQNERLIMTGKDSWTLSYCFKEMGWKSWHSYIPDWYVYTLDTFYSILDKGLWKHNSGKFTTYYGLEFPCVKEFIIKEGGTTFLPQSVIYHANVYNFDNGYWEDVIDVTYDQMLAYNDRQSTGIQNLVLDSDNNVFYDNFTTYVIQTDRNYKISSLKDLANSSNIWTTDISSVKVGSQGYTDLVPQVDFTKNEVEVGEFRSKWIAIRLITNNHNHKFTLEFQDVNSQQSIR